MSMGTNQRLEEIRSTHGGKKGRQEESRKRNEREGKTQFLSNVHVMYLKRDRDYKENLQHYTLLDIQAQNPASQPLPLSQVTHLELLIFRLPQCNDFLFVCFHFKPVRPVV